RVQAAYEAALQARAQGTDCDLLDVLVRQKLLTCEQAGELRLDLASTHFDLGPDATPVKARKRRKTPIARPAATNGASTRDGDAPPHDLRTLGRFHLLRRLGEGGMGAVYLGYQEGEDNQVAIKVLSDHLVSSQASVDRFY